MTKEAIQKSTKKKIQTIEQLMKQLEIVISAEEVVTTEGFIRRVVYFTDTEKYEVDEEVTPKKDETTA